jgi:hypothetical protein
MLPESPSDATAFVSNVTVRPDSFTDAILRRLPPVTATAVERVAMSQTVPGSSTSKFEPAATGTVRPGEPPAPDTVATRPVPSPRNTRFSCRASAFDA